jgi:hypothetical protein
MPIVSIPPPYRGPTRGEARVEVEGGTARECLVAVDARYAGFLALVLDAEGGLHRFVKLFVSERPLTGETLDAPLDPDAELTVIAAIGGG